MSKENKKRKGILCLILSVLFVISASAIEWDLDYHIVEPTEYYNIYVKEDVLFNLTANITAPQNTVNVSLYIRTRQYESYKDDPNNYPPYMLNVSGLVLINGSYISTTLKFQDETRVWFYWVFIDNQSRVIRNTSIRIFDVIVDYDHNCATLIVEDFVFDIEFIGGIYLQNIHRILDWKGIPFEESYPIDQYDIKIYPCVR